MIERVLTFGEKAVGLSFNPGGNMKVDQIKRAYAEVIDLLQQIRIETPDVVDYEVSRMLAVAITEAQTSQMWAVKAVTWGSP